MEDPTKAPERRWANLFIAVIAGGGLLIGIILLARSNSNEGTPGNSFELAFGIILIIAALLVPAGLYLANNRRHIRAKAQQDEPKEFDDPEE